MMNYILMHDECNIVYQVRREIHADIGSGVLASHLVEQVGTIEGGDGLKRLPQRQMFDDILSGVRSRRENADISTVSLSCLMGACGDCFSRGMCLYVFVNVR